MTLIRSFDASKQSLIESAVTDAVRGMERDDWPSFCLDRQVGRVVVIVARPEQLATIAAGLVEPRDSQHSVHQRAVEGRDLPAGTSARVASEGSDAARSPLSPPLSPQEAA